MGDVKAKGGGPKHNKLNFLKIFSLFLTSKKYFSQESPAPNVFQFENLKIRDGARSENLGWQVVMWRAHPAPLPPSLKMFPKNVVEMLQLKVS